MTVECVRSAGPGPTLSILIDLGWRLLRYGDTESLRQFSKLRRAYRRFKRSPSGPNVVIMRSDGYAYRAYSENVGWVVSKLLYSDFGVKQVSLGYSPENLLRIAALADSCEGITEAEKAISPAQRAKTLRGRRKTLSTCELLVRDLDSKLGTRGAGDLSVAIGELDGVQPPGEGCVASLVEDRKETQLVERFEDFTACRVTSSGQPTDRKDWIADGFSFDGVGNIDPGPVPIHDRSRAEIRIDPQTGQSKSLVINDKEFEGTGTDGTPIRITVYQESEFDAQTGTLKPGDMTTSWSNTERGQIVDHPNGSKDFWVSDGQGNSVSGHVNSNGTMGSTSDTQNLGGGTSQTTDIQRDGNGNTTGTTVSVSTDNGDGTTTTQTFVYRFERQRGQHNNNNDDDARAFHTG